MQSSRQGVQGRHVSERGNLLVMMLCLHAVLEPPGVLDVSYVYVIPSGSENEDLAYGVHDGGKRVCAKHTVQI